MTWLRLDDTFHLHDKVAPLSDRAFRLHVTAQLECCRRLTNGNVAAKLPSTWPRAPRGRSLRATVAELVETGLWEPVGDWGWQIHDFLDWNPHSSEVEALREKRREAGRVGGKRSAEARADAKQPAKQMPKQVLEQMPSKTEPRSRSRSRSPDLPPDGGREARPPASPPVPDLTDSDAETVCPLDLVARARERGVLTQLADGLRVPLVSVEAKAHEFVAYWTLGEKAGHRRRHWMSKLRKDIHEAAKANRLPAPGAIEHQGGMPGGGPSPVLAALLARGGR